MELRCAAPKLWQGESYPSRQLGRVSERQSGRAQLFLAFFRT